MVCATKTSLPIASANQPTDAELILAIQAGDDRAMHKLLERHEGTIKAIFYKLAPDFTDNSDLVQEAMIRMWRGSKNLKNPHAFKTWLNQIVTNLFYDALRRRQNTATISLDAPIGNDQESEGLTREIACSKPKPEEALLNNELANVLNLAVSKMPEKFSKPVVMRDMQGLSYEEIAVITNTELGTVKSRINRGRLKMQKTMNLYLNDRLAA